jgi:hypothetical protein
MSKQQTRARRHPTFLPRMMPLQFLVVHILFDGRQSAYQVRKLLEAKGLRKNASSFSRLMSRLVREGYVHRQYRKGTKSDPGTRQCLYDVTTFGIAVWKLTQQFYRERSPPPPGLVPVITEYEVLNGGRQNHRKQVIWERLVKEFPELYRKIKKVKSSQREAKSRKR